MNLLYENKPLFDKIDKDLQKGTDHKTIDKRIESVGRDKYMNESYELFRLEFSDFINKEDNAYLKKKFMSLMTNLDIEYDTRVKKIRLLLYRLINKDLLPTYLKMTGENYIDSDDQEQIEDQIEDENENENEENIQTGGKINKIAYILDSEPNTAKYQINNDRSICKTLSKDTCSTNPHCHWSHAGCLIAFTTEMAVEFINKISNELATNDLKAMEIMKIGNYFVSDVVDYTRFTERDGQKIVRSNSNSIKKVLFDIFGKDNIPKIGKRRTNKGLDVNYQDMNDDNPIKDLREMYIQNIIQNNLTIFRTYVNGYYWLKHPFYDVESRNLGYYSPLQTDLANYFKSIVIDWLSNTKNTEVIERDVVKYMNIKKKSKNIISDYVTKLGSDTHTLTNCIIELYVINKIQQIPIVVYNNDNDVVYIFDDDIIWNKYIDTSKSNIIDKYTNLDKSTIINMQFSFISSGSVPDEIDIIYYKSIKKK